MHVHSWLYAQFVDLTVPFFCSDSATVDSLEEEDVYNQYPIGPGLQFSRAEEAHSHVEELLEIEEQKFIISETRLIDLFRGRCQEPGCASECTVKSKSVGCTMELWWKCQNGHKGKWHSSEEYGGMYSNNLQFSSAVLLSGNNHSKIELMSRFLGLSCPSRASFLRVQKFYCVPAIDEWWEWMRTNIISLIGTLESVVSGDGQSHSPGHSAKYLTYFVMVTDALQEYIVHLECMDKREVGGNHQIWRKRP